VEGGANRWALSSGDGERGGAALCYARENAKEERREGRLAGLWACMHASWLGQLGRGAWLATAAERRSAAGVSACARGRGPGHYG
jgi:hypothetical protein